MQIVHDGDFAFKSLRKKFGGNKFFHNIVQSKLRSLGNCISKRTKFSKTVINAMDEIGRRELSDDEFFSFVNKVFEEINALPDQGPLNSFQLGSMASRTSSYVKGMRYVNNRSENGALPHGVRQTLVKNVDCSYIEQMDVILKDIMYANCESEGHMISLCESVGYILAKRKESNEQIYDLRALVYARYSKLRSNPHW